ncbi:unnamed protein product [Didymodactylos carnosus]|uniref:RNA helicase n=1 Tax=Didymodactylos carnosus TaxID=1234261 RepID=A0A814J2C9_9BILA|nr:unnamed protein product [Didymodactylos carnosus]CAF1118086.1 unnamed protein product [Didymodactylos carnosus]CAF3801184.1 unnamed protein product [Didymodactylos carnosus]CAF3889893.1 unnamed protein product [Didymodactylos carnosus]
MSVRFASQPSESKDDSDVDEVSRSFYDFGLDNRLLKSIADLQWENPTPIQAETIPYALIGKDLLVKARTGSAAIQHLLSTPVVSSSSSTESIKSIRILVLSPTKELCHQISQVFVKLSTYCRREIDLYDLSNSLSTTIQKQTLSLFHNKTPDIIIATPTKLLEHLKENHLNISKTEMFIVDEADILYSLGYTLDMNKISKYLPPKSKSYQCFLISATLNNDILKLKNLFLHNPVLLKQNDDYTTILPDSKQLQHYYINCENEQKFIIILTVFKLNLLYGRTILFVNTVEQGYRLKLFLEQFHIKTCLLNSELPMDSRLHIVQQYNDGLYDIMIATDELYYLTEPKDTTDGNEEVKPEETSTNKKKKKTKEKSENVGRKQDKEYGVSRGIDFYRVANIINFDFPHNLDSYVHRVGRTARVDQKGLALSLINQNEIIYFDDVREQLLNEYDEDVFKLYRFKAEQVDGFRYRGSDALRSITRTAIREARLKEIKSELLNSKKLKIYFNDNKKESQLLRHDSALHIVKVKEHLKHVPDYLIPSALKKKSNDHEPITTTEPQTTSTTTAAITMKNNNKRKFDINSDANRMNMKKMKRLNPLTNSFDAMATRKRQKTRQMSPVIDEASSLTSSNNVDMDYVSPLERDNDLFLLHLNDQFDQFCNGSSVDQNSSFENLIRNLHEYELDYRTNSLYYSTLKQECDNNDQKITSNINDIQSLRTTINERKQYLNEVKLRRRHQYDYDIMANIILRLPSRSLSENKLRTLNSDIEHLKSELTALNNQLLTYQKQSKVVLYSLLELVGFIDVKLPINFEEEIGRLDNHNIEMQDA